MSDKPVPRTFAVIEGVEHTCGGELADFHVLVHFGTGDRRVPPDAEAIGVFVADAVLREFASNRAFARRSRLPDRSCRCLRDRRDAGVRRASAGSRS